MTSARILQFPIEPAYTAQLHAYLLGRVRDPSEADDIMQEAWARYLELPKDRVVQDPARYVFTIARNLIVERGKQRANSRVRFDSTLAEKCVLPDESPDVCRSMIAAEELREALESMYPTSREVLLLNKVEGLDHREIAARLRVKPRTVLNHLARAVMRARSKLGEGNGR
jgi:RNA polymerase sigma factor (sigma-70 family)